jgi:hypothetical protein
MPNKQKLVVSGVDYNKQKRKSILCERGRDESRRRGRAYYVKEEEMKVEEVFYSEQKRFQNANYRGNNTKNQGYAGFTIRKLWM